MSAMGDVLALIAAGVTERAEMATKANITPRQVESAINNLRYAGKIEKVQDRSLGRHKGRIQSIYRVCTDRQDKKKMQNVRVNSVFQLGEIK